MTVGSVGNDPCAARYACSTSAAAPTVTGVERLVPPHVVHAFWPSMIVFSVASPGAYEPSATTSTPFRPFAPGPRFDHSITSLSVTCE